MAEITNLRDAFLDEIRDIYHAEKQLLKALPKLAKAASDVELRGALENHLAETENQVSRLEQVFELVGEKPETRTCAGMAGIIEEGSDVLGEDSSPVLDAMIIASAQRAEHYEIAAYGTVAAWAEGLGYTDAAELLRETLDEEKTADETLTGLAESGINAAAGGVGAGRGTGAHRGPDLSGSPRPHATRPVDAVSAGLVPHSGAHVAEAPQHQEALCDQLVERGEARRRSTFQNRAAWGRVRRRHGISSYSARMRCDSAAAGDGTRSNARVASGIDTNLPASPGARPLPARHRGKPCRFDPSGDAVSRVGDCRTSVDRCPRCGRRPRSTAESRWAGHPARLLLPCDAGASIAD